MDYYNNYYPRYLESKKKDHHKLAILAYLESTPPPNPPKKYKENTQTHTHLFFLIKNIKVNSLNYKKEPTRDWVAKERG